MAFKIPNFLRRLFAEGSFSQAFVPVISEYKVKRPRDEVRELVDGVAGTFGVILFFVTLIGVIAAPLIILAFAPGWHGDDDKFQLAVGDAALDVPLSVLHLADGAVLGCAEQLRQFRACRRSRRSS